MRNGYEMIYKPEHHRSDSTGYVYEHIVIAEEKLKRKLNNEECVHHLNKIRNDNREENLIVFKTIADHTAFHMGSDIILDGDVYIALPNNNLICPFCKKQKSHKSQMCIDCWRIFSRKVERPTKEELQGLLLNNTFVDVGKHFGVSDNTIRKWCKNYGLPYKYENYHKKKEKAESKIINDTYKVKMSDENTCVEFNNINFAIDYLYDNEFTKRTTKRNIVRDNIVRAFKKEKKYYGFNWIIYK